MSPSGFVQSATAPSNQPVCLVPLGDSFLRLVQYSIQDYREKLYQDILKRRKELRKAEKERAGQSNGVHRSRTRTRPSADQPRYR